jgi:hypothetical protein
LEDFDAAFAIYHALNPPFQIFERDGIHVMAGAHRRVRVTSRARQIAGINDFNQGEAGGKLIKRSTTLACGIAAQNAGHGMVRSAIGGAIRLWVWRTIPATAAGIVRVAFGQPIKTGV